MKPNNSSWRYIDSLPAKHLSEYQLQRRFVEGAKTEDLEQALKFYADNRDITSTIKEIFLGHPPIHVQAWRDLIDERHSR